MWLKDPLTIQNNLSVSYSYRKLAVRLSASYYTTANELITVCDYIDNPSDPLYGKFLQTTENSKRYNKFSSNLSIGLNNLFNHLSLRVYGSYSNQSVKGYGHEWKKCSFNVGGYAAVYLGQWQISAQASPLPTYDLVGNMLWRNFTSWSTGVSWHNNAWSISCRIADLFKKRAFYQKKTTMAIDNVIESRSWIADKNNWVEIRVRYQFNFGKRLNKPQQNAGGDNRVDSGVTVSY